MPLWECCIRFHALMASTCKSLKERLPRNKFNDVAKARPAYARQRKPKPPRALDDFSPVQVFLFLVGIPSYFVQDFVHQPDHKEIGKHERGLSGVFHRGSDESGGKACGYSLDGHAYLPDHSPKAGQRFFPFVVPDLDHLTVRQVYHICPVYMPLDTEDSSMPMYSNPSRSGLP